MSHEWPAPSARLRPRVEAALGSVAGELPGACPGEADGAEDLVLLEIARQFHVANPRGTPEAYSLTPTTAELVASGPPWGRDEWRGEPTALLADIQGL